MIGFQTYHTILLVLILFLFTITKQQAVDPIILKVGQRQNYTIPASATKLFKFNIQNDTMDTNGNFYIAVKPNTNNFFKRPAVHISSTDNFSVGCYDADERYTDLCIIDGKDIKNHHEFQMNISCVLQCAPQIHLYFQYAYQWKYNNQLILNANDQQPLTEQIVLLMPQENFTSIELIARLEDFEYADQGIQMFVNYGPAQTLTSPTLKNYTQKSISLWNNAQGIIIPSQKLKKGDKIIIFIIVPLGQEAILRNNLVMGNKYSLNLNDQMGDVIAGGKQKFYQLKLKENQLKQLGQQQINIRIVLYSGNPIIDVGFTDQLIEGQFETWFISGAINYPITAEMRKKNNFVDQLYVKISCKEDCSYEIAAQISRSDYVFLDLQSTQIQQVIGEEVVNYFYEERVSVPTKMETFNLSYNLKVQLISGGLQLKMGRCKQLQSSNDISKCIIKTPSQMTISTVKQRFSEIYNFVKKTSNIFEISWIMDIKKCPVVQQILSQSGSNIHICEYQMVIFNDKDQENIQDSIYALTLTSQNQLTWLRQGHIYRSNVRQDQYKYYAFEIANIPQIQQVAFHLTIIQGKGLLVGSTTDKFPSVDGNNTFGQRNSLVFSGDKKTAIFYVGVFGVQHTDFTIIVVTKKTASDQKTGITLQQNVVLNYTLPINQTKAIFYINANPKQSIKLEVYSLQGNISYNLRNIQDEKTDQNLCLNNVEDPCYITAPDSTKTKYILTVNGSFHENQVFTILYGDATNKKCIEQPMNHPIFISLSAQNQQCIQYVLTDPKSIQLSLSVQSIRLFSNNLLAYAQIRQNDIRITERSFHLTPSMIFQLCNKQREHKSAMLISNCNLKITLKSDKNLDLGMIVQDQDIQFTLFEGIQQRITDQNISLDQSFKKYFTTNVYSLQDRYNLLIMSYTHASYNISIKVIKQADYNSFSKDIKQIFPTYEKGLKDNNTKTQSSNQRFIIIQIDPKLFLNSEDHQIILITVQGKVNGLQKQFTGADSYLSSLQFDIQISRLQSQLPIGQAKAGYVSQNEIKSYYVLQGSYLSAQVSLTSFYSDQCAIVTAGVVNDKMNNKTSRNFVILNDSSVNYTIFVIGISDCAYQISLQDLSIPVTEIITTLPIYVESNETKYFLYNHKSMQNIDILQRFAIGDSTIYVKSASYSENISQLLKLQTDRYSLNNGANKADIQIDRNSPNFCQGCFYLIAIVPNSIVKQQLIIVLEEQRIPLKQNYYIRLYIESRLAKRLVYHSKTNFNLNLQKLSGRVQITVRNQLLPSFKSIVLLNNSDSILIQAPKLPQMLQNSITDEFDNTFKYQIDIFGLDESLVAVSVDKNNTFKTLTTGIPVQIEFEQEKIGVKFKVLDEQKPINILVEILCESTLQENEYEFTLQYDKYVNKPQSRKQKSEITVNQVENSFEITANGTVAQYYFYIAPRQSVGNQTVKAVILLEGQKISHLKSGSESIHTKNSTFQVFVTGDSMMIQVFQCQGQVSVTGTSNLSALNAEPTNNSQKISLEHWNNGGHYVITTQSYSGLYFISVNATDSSIKPVYLVRYHEYNGIKSNLYRNFNFQPHFSFTQEKDTINIIIEPVTASKRANNQVEGVTYTLIIGQNPQMIQKIAQCSQQKNEALIYNVSINEIKKDYFNQVVIKVNKNQIQDFLKKKQMQYFFVGASAELYLIRDYLNQQIPPTLYFTYDTIQMTLGQSKNTIVYQQNSNIQEILIYLVLPFLIGSILIFLSCRFFIRRVYTLYPSRLVEDDPVAQSQQGIQQSAYHEQIK